MFIIENLLLFVDVDQAKNFSFNENSRSISFDRPRGFYDKLFVLCSAEDQSCSKNSLILTNITNNCSNCTSMKLSSMIKGVSYKCRLITMKKGFSNITSDQFRLNTCNS